MAVQQTECYRVVTIGYLKSFIGTNIQNSANGSVISISRSDDTYCPTYSELTGGTIIQTWSQGSTPNGDRDGITVNSSAVLGGNYANNQLVDQRDLGLKYTRFKSFSVSSASGDISQCGGSKSLSYSHIYTRYTKSMNDSCATSTTSSDVSDTANGEVSWNPGSYGSVSYPTYSIGRQPETRTAGRRCTTVTGSITFRGAGHSDTTQICQSALGGSYNNYEGRHYTGVSVYPSTSSTFGCNGGDFYVTSTGYYYDRYEWKDDCGTVYHSSPYNDVNGSESAGSDSSSFGALDCCNGTQSRSTSLSISYHGYSDSATFTQYCEDCSSQCGPPAPTCARGTDNGTDVIGGVSYTHPMLLCAIAYTDSDSTYVRDLKYNGSTLSSSWVRVNDWLEIRRDTDGSGSVCGYGWVHYRVTKNDTGSIRTTTLTFSTSDSEVCTDSPVYKKYGIKNACSEWEVEVKQAPCGYYWCGDHSYTSVLVPCGSSCQYGSDGSTCEDDCDCSEPPGPGPDENNVRLTMVGDSTIFNEGIQSIKFKMTGYDPSFGIKNYNLHAYVDGCPGIESCPDKQGEVVDYFGLSANREYTYNLGRGWSEGEYLTVIISPENGLGNTLFDEYRITRE